MKVTVKDVADALLRGRDKGGQQSACSSISGRTCAQSSSSATAKCADDDCYRFSENPTDDDTCHGGGVTQYL
jgi:hypothetical protein